MFKTKYNHSFCQIQTNHNKLMKKLILLKLNKEKMAYMKYI